MNVKAYNNQIFIIDRIQPIQMNPDIRSEREIESNKFHDASVKKNTLITN